MLNKNKISISKFPPDQRDTVFKILVFQKLCKGKFLLQEPWPYDELDEDEVYALRDVLREFMPLDTMVTDMWDWDIHFEDRAFEDTYFDISLGPEEFAIEQAEFLKEDLLAWIDEYGIDYAQEQGDKQEEFENWVYDNCVKFIKGWRLNIVKSFM